MLQSMLSSSNSSSSLYVRRQNSSRQSSTLSKYGIQFHDFPKLRELHHRRLSKLTHAAATQRSSAASFHTMTSSGALLSQSMPSSSTLASSTSTSMLASTSMSTRSLFSLPNIVSTRMAAVQLKTMERLANARPNDTDAQFKFVQQLYQEGHYQAVVDRVGHEMFRNLSIDGRIALLYLQAMQQTNQYNQFQMEEFGKRLGLGNIPDYQDVLEESRKLSKSQQVANVTRYLMSGGVAMAATSPAGMLGGAVAAAAGLRGVDPKNPVHVQLHNPTSTRAALLGLTGRVLLAFVVVSAISAVLDEKGVGRGLGMNSGSKHVQEVAERSTKVTFDDVKGVQEAKAELEEIVMYLRDPAKFTRLGGKLPRGLLLTGPPGTGKTLLAKAIAGEAAVPFFYSSGSQFEEVYVGLGAKRIRELFETAKTKSPCIVFIDEIDAVGGTRKLKDQSALKMTLNELLVQMDGFEENNGVIVIGATNFMESLDQALLRPGRFDKHVVVPLPDVGGRKEILEMYAKKTKLHTDVDLNVTARGTTGFSGADLSNLINQAALKASVDGLPSINMHTLEYAKDKIMMGAERKTAVITPETARCTAYHEAGHALVAVLTEGSMPIHKATIMPRGQALGMVTMLPEGDQTSQSLKQMVAMMDVSMGGRVAEELIFGREEATSGAMSDISNATRIARNMVTKFGFSEEIGLVHHGGQTGEEHASEDTRNKIDSEVKRLTDSAYKRAKDLLSKYSKQHHLLAQTLLEYETLTGQEVIDIVKKGIKPQRPVINKDGGARGNQDVLAKSDGQGKQRKRRLPGFGQDAAPPQ